MFASSGGFTLLLVFAVSCVANAGQDAINPSLLNSKVERSIDIASQIVKISTRITVENNGKTAASYVLYTIPEEIKKNLAYIGASTQDESKTPLRVVETAVAEHKDKPFWKVELKQPVEPSKTVSFTVETSFTHLLVPHPSHIAQSEKQLVLYYGDHYFYSPYLTRTQTTTVTLPSSSIESYSKLKPVSQSDNTIIYGPYENAAAFSTNKMTVHYENNSPFLAVTSLERTIEVSHWGVISVEEVIDLKHVGAVLKGPFSRYEFQREQSGISAVKSFETALPASAMDVYYRDEIGNISTSHLRVLDDSVEVEIRPRFPLFGGWKTHYVLGYYVPTYEYLYNSGDQYVLRMRFVDHIFDDSVIDHATVKVILPEGVTDIKLKLPFPITRGPDTLHYTYLDTVGRPAIILHKQNLVEHHIQDFEVHYKFKKLLMLQEPLLMVVALYLLFVLVIIYVRLDFTITKDPHRESALKVTSISERILSYHDKRTDLYAQYDAAIAKFKSSRDSSACQATVKKLNTELKQETQAITDLMVNLKHEGSDIVEKVSELQRLDKNLKKYFQQQLNLMEKLVAGKMSKQQFMDEEADITKNKEEIAEKMQGISNLL